MEVADTHRTPIRAVTERMTMAEGLELVRQWQESGLSGRAFSRARGIGEYRLWYWKKRAATLAAEAAEPGPDDFVVMESREIEASEPNEAVEAVDEAIEIVLGDGDLVRIPKGTASLLDILSAVRAAQR